MKQVAVREKGMEPTKLTAGEVKGRMDRGERFAFVDVRRLDEGNESASRLPGAIRMATDEVEQHLDQVPQGRTIITYGDSPTEESSTRVALELMRRGFLNVHPLIGGLDAWRRAGGPVEPT
jgi:rhodanese-related sulfurtransferase